MCCINSEFPNILFMLFTFSGRILHIKLLKGCDTRTGGLTVGRRNTALYGIYIIVNSVNLICSENQRTHAQIVSNEKCFFTVRNSFLHVCYTWIGWLELGLRIPQFCVPTVVNSITYAEEDRK